MSASDRPGHPLAEQVLGELRLAVDRLGQHLADLAGELVVEQLRFLARGPSSTTSNANAMCIDSSRNTQLVPDARPLSRPRERRK